jgi:hypothetical protein
VLSVPTVPKRRSVRRHLWRGGRAPAGTHRRRWIDAAATRGARRVRSQGRHQDRAGARRDGNDGSGVTPGQGNQGFHGSDRKEQVLPYEPFQRRPRPGLGWQG